MVWFGLSLVLLVWFGLVWFGMLWLGLVGFGLVKFGLVDKANTSLSKPNNYSLIIIFYEITCTRVFSKVYRTVLHDDCIIL